MKIKCNEVVSLWVATFLFGIFFFGACKPANTVSKWIKLEGETMGTTYHITLEGSEMDKMQVVVDSTLQIINASLSTYIPTSFISRFNDSENGEFVQTTGDSELEIHFQNVWNISQKCYYLSRGAFDPAASPLFRIWGFAEKKRSVLPEKMVIDSVLTEVGFDSIRFRPFHKSAKEQSVNFNAVAKGYGVDKVFEALKNSGIKNLMVEIGGEVRAEGVNPNGGVWRIGINKPEENSSPDDFITTVNLDNESMATSGNYRNYYYLNGKKYSHTVDPRTGYPTESDILSATIMAPTCAEADALATACMVLGSKQSVEMLAKTKGVKAVLITGLTDQDIIRFGF
ncbi:MAG: FAD:protein FMN transferase [Bacteroidetes bacterium]|nr:FAD:protein FMN transferase [Bacteroidota bacterium]